MAMRRGTFVFLMFGIAATLGACTTARPLQQCRTLSPTAPESSLHLPAAGEPADGTIDILLLSGGGFWGSYGAGFLTGWSRRPATLGLERPEFELVTGVSTGAIMVPFVLIGPGQDGKLRNAYNGVAGGDLLPRQSLFRMLRSNAFAGAGRLKESIGAALDDSVLDGMAEAARSGRSALIGATNFDDSRFTIFDLTQIARHETKERARELIRDRIVASSAFPLLLPAQFVDGCMYMDGSVRQSHFIPGPAEMEAFLSASRSVPAGRVRIFTILNGPVTSDRRLVENNFLTLLSRSAELAIDQVQLETLRNTFDYAGKNGFEFYWTSADLAGQAELRKACGAPPNPLRDFSPDFTRCLFAVGERSARTLDKPWRRDRP